MPTTTVTSRAFNQDTGAAKRAAQTGPVVITDRGEPSHVLLSIEEYRRLESNQRSLLDAARDWPPEIADIDIEFPKLTGFPRIPDFD